MTDAFDRENDIAAYVLGLMNDAEREHFDRRMAGDPGLAHEVQRLVAHFHALDDTVEPEPISDALWEAVERQIADTAQQSPANENVSPSGTRTSRDAIRFALMAASVVGALGIGFIGGTLTQPTPEAPLVVAVLTTDNQQPGAIIEAFGDDSVRLIPLEELVAPQGQVLEMWTLPDEETGPVSLGTFERAADLRLTGPDLPPPLPNQLYEITVEPAGGSPTGLPTGPIVLIGNAQAPVRF